MFTLPARPTLFPYTTLFRSRQRIQRVPSEGIRRAHRAGVCDGRHAARDRQRRDPEERAASECREAAVCLHVRSEEHTSELQSRQYLVCRLLLEKKNKLEKLK